MHRRIDGKNTAYEINDKSKKINIIESIRYLGYLGLCFILLSPVLAGDFSLSADQKIAEGPPVENMSLNIQKNETNNKIVLIGASYAEGLKIDEISGKHVINMGIGGQQSFEMLARFKSDVIDLKPEKVIIWGFINDIFRADRKKIQPAISKIKDSYEKMVNFCKNNNVQPILATEVTMASRGGVKEMIVSTIAKVLGKTSYQDYINQHVMEVNGWLRLFAKKNNIMVLDLETLLIEDKSNKRKKIYAKKDGSHISENGYRVITEYIRKKVTWHNK